MNQDIENASPHITCEICYSSQLEFPELRFICLEQCSHSFCSECLEETYRSLIEDQNVVVGERFDQNRFTGTTDRIGELLIIVGRHGVEDTDPQIPPCASTEFHGIVKLGEFGNGRLQSGVACLRIGDIVWSAKSGLAGEIDAAC